jgi:hypothetical protein
MPRNVRINDELWNAALVAARSRNETLSDVIRRKLEEYLRETHSE